MGQPWIAREGDIMIRKLTVLAVGGLAALAALSVSNQAAAGDETFGKQGQMAFSADRLFGVNFNKFTTNYKQNSPNGQTEAEWEDSSTQVGLLWSQSTASYSAFNGTGLDGTTRPNPSAIPRLSFDYFVIDGLTLGGSLGYISLGGTQSVTKFNTPAGPAALPPDHDHTSVTGFAFAPRVGYAYMFNDVIGIWPRGGFTYFHYSSETKQYNGQNAVDHTDKESFGGLDLNLEAMLVISPVRHFAFVVGPVFDLGLTGGVDISRDPPDPNNTLPAPDISVKHTNFGLTSGLLGYF
jgi:hypothetical protein